MPDEFKPGDKVEWHGPGVVRGEVVRKLTERTETGEHTVAASPDNPEYLVRSDASGKEAAHKPGALRRVRS